MSRESDGAGDEDDVGEVLLLPQLREVRVKDALEDRSLGQLRSWRTKRLLEQKFASTWLSWGPVWCLHLYNSKFAIQTFRLLTTDALIT